MSVKNWKISSGSTKLGQVLRFVPGIEQSKIVSKALDGTIHVQTIGIGTKYANVDIFCDVNQFKGVNTAEASGSLVTVIYKDKKYLGYIESPPSWNTVIPGEWYSTNIKILIISEVSL